MRKAALVLGELERNLMAGREDRERVAAYARGLGTLLIEDERASEEVRASAHDLATAKGGEGLLRAIDALRHALIRATGQAPADWDLIDPATGRPDAKARSVRPGIRVYLEDLRSPFNVGAIFRTADAFGVEELMLSPRAAEPRHPRSSRSAMGAVDLVPWRRIGIEALDEGAFALELGGEPIDDFRFPLRGIAVIGSEELGVSPKALARCGLGRVSIPMSGAKGSLNAAVAFGVLMYAWTRSLDI